MEKSVLGVMEAHRILGVGELGGWNCDEARG